MSARKPENAVEEEFLAVVKAHAKEINEAYDKAIILSEKYGIPFGAYCPVSFKEKYHRTYDYEADLELDYVNHRWAGQICPVDSEFWYSSTTECELYQ